jgi:hypothetical protein
MGLILLNAKYESLGYLKFAIIKDLGDLSRKKAHLATAPGERPIAGGVVDKSPLDP